MQAAMRLLRQMLFFSGEMRLYINVCSLERFSSPSNSSRKESDTDSSFPWRASHFWTSDSSSGENKPS